MTSSSGAHPVNSARTGPASAGGACGTSGSGPSWNPAYSAYSASTSRNDQNFSVGKPASSIGAS